MTATATATKTPTEVLKEAGIDLTHPHDEVHDSIEPEGCYVDAGIGPYEYWGFRCRHVQIEFECEDVGEVSVEWCQLEAPDLDEIAEYSYWAVARIANAHPEDDRDGGDVTVKATMVKFSAERASVKTDEYGGCVRYWRCTATFDWEAE